MITRYVVSFLCIFFPSSYLRFFAVTSKSRVPVIG